jgi:hypothetical protein
VSFYTVARLTFAARTTTVAKSVFRSDSGDRSAVEGSRRGVIKNGQLHIVGERRDDVALGQQRPGRWGALVRDALAIYITVLLVVMVAIAQLLYFKLVLARAKVVGEETPDIPDMDWLRKPPVEAWVGLEADEAEPALVGDPVLVGV